ncbi:ABC transporter substrate-binding protein [Pseudothauera rhizosphaerae]|uniref:Iron ABC transporter substrate-binding protein n=1 Tax=Pseudothauera rhizosphaerae TaxID=2565932 RepID=A0A4S4A9U6_9RHOO|nr:ABC transporter substrate-binding protein [Pseudothauera rhizosphaerae]THF55630.1 iron ABC transporter substrate-binding protein [Pseudothauera rhizosphaerae]
MKTRWRRIGAGLALTLGLAAGPLHAADDAVTDLAGRTLRVPANTQRILLGEARLIPALAVLERETLGERIVGMPADFELLDPPGYAQYLERYPQLREVARTGRMTADTFSVEMALSLKPDLAIFGLEGHGPSPEHRETLDRLAAAGVTVVFVDFRKEPLRNTPRSIEVLGRVLGREGEAAAFVEEYEAQLARVTERLAARTADGPTVFIENRVGLSEECCATMSEGLMGTLLDAAGGRNVAKGLVPGAFGVLSLEHLVSRPPEVYIGTAIGSRATMERMPMRIVLGPGVDGQTARESLARALQRPGIATLPAVRQGRAHAIWHHFYVSPFNVVAVQVFAKWLYPELFADLRPEETLAMFYRRFQPVPLDGEYWTSLGAEGAVR